MKTSRANRRIISLHQGVSPFPLKIPNIDQTMEVIAGTIKILLLRVAATNIRTKAYPARFQKYPPKQIFAVLLCDVNVANTTQYFNAYYIHMVNKFNLDY